MTPLHYFGDIIRNLMLAIPLPMVRVLFIATFVALLLWVWRLPREMTSPPNGARHWSENLKVGATLALVIQILVYLLL